MNKFSTQCLVFGLMLFVPSLALAHGGHAQDSIFIQIVHFEHILMYLAPLLVVAGLVYAIHTKSRRIQKEEVRNEK